MKLDKKVDDQLFECQGQLYGLNQKLYFLGELFERQDIENSVPDLRGLGILLKDLSNDANQVSKDLEPF